MLRTDIQEEFLSKSAHISTMRHFSIKLNKWIRLDIVAFTHGQRTPFEIKILAESQQGMHAHKSLERCQNL